MPQLKYSHHDFQRHVENKDLVLLNKEGEWSLFASPFNFLANSIGLKSWIQKRNSQALSHLFDANETMPLVFPTPVGMISQDLPNTAEKMLSQYFDPFLAYRLLAFRYRIEGVNGGINASTSIEGDITKLKEIASAWRASKKLFWSADLNEHDIKSLDSASKWTEFVKLVLQNENLREKFFEWTIRDRLPVDVFIEYPYVTHLINDYRLYGRIGTLGGDKLKIQKIRKGNSYQKVVTLPFEGKDISLLDENFVVHFRGGYHLSIKEILILFRDKPRRFVDVEYFAQGVCNWNSQYMGYWIPSTKSYSQIDLEQNEWWRQLPPLEIMSKEEARARYGDFVNGLNWVVSAKAAREHLNLNYERCHAYLEIAIPTNEGSYSIYDFGKFARFFPYGVVDNMRMFTITTPATVAYPDENIYHTARQQIGYAFEMHHYEGLRLMEEIRLDILRSRSGNMIFQVEAENCGHWIQTHLEELFGKEHVPNLFRAKLLKSEAEGVVGALFKVVRRLPPFLQSPALNLIHYPFGPWKGQYVIDRNGERVFKALVKTPFWSDIIVYMPALLHKQYERGYFSSNVDYEDYEEAVEKGNSNIVILDKTKVSNLATNHFFTK